MFEKVKKILGNFLSPQYIDLNYVVVLGNVNGDCAIPVQHALYYFAYWLYYYIFVHVLYYSGGLIFYNIFTFFYPKAETLKISNELTMEQIRLSETAFPLYSAIPALSNLFVRLGISKLQPSVEDTGGYVVSFRNLLIYLFFVEGMIYYVHYWLLHKWS